MRYRPFWLLNTTERERIVARTVAGYSEWCRAWLPSPWPVELSVECVAAHDCRDWQGSPAWMSFAADGALVAVADAERAAALLRSALGGAAAREAPPEGSIADALVQAAWTDLAQRLLGSGGDGPGTGHATGLNAGLNTDPTRSDEPLPPTVWQRGSGAACIRLPLAGGELAVLLDPVLVTRIVGPRPRPAPRGGTLAPPQQSLGRLRVPVEVWLGTAAIDIAAFDTLAPDDVLLLDARIDEALRLTVAGVVAAPRAVLGRSGTRRAVRLQS